MKIKTFTQTCTEHFWRGRVFKPELIEPEINEWLAAHPQVQVREIRHDTFSSFLGKPVLLVSLYYAE